VPDAVTVVPQHLSPARKWIKSERIDPLLNFWPAPIKVPFHNVAAIFLLDLLDDRLEYFEELGTLTLKVLKPSLSVGATAVGDPRLWHVDLSVAEYRQPTAPFSHGISLSFCRVAVLADQRLIDFIDAKITDDAMT
jgi:hypothetical protein